MTFYEKQKLIRNTKSPLIRGSGNRGNSFLSFGGEPFDLTGLKAYYTFEASSSPILNQSSSGDSLGTNANGTGNGTLTYSQTGKISNAVLFDGSSGYFVLGTTAGQWNFTFGAGCTFSINLWYKQTNTASGTVLRFFSQNSGSGGGDAEKGISFGLNNGTGVSFFAATSSSDYYLLGTIGSVATDDTDWHMLTITYDEDGGSDNFKTYFDGTAKGTFTGSTATAASNPSNSAKMGRNASSAIEYWDGLLDEYSIWSRVLSPDEITALYNGGAGLSL